MIRFGERSRAFAHRAGRAPARSPWACSRPARLLRLLAVSGCSAPSTLLDTAGSLNNLGRLLRDLGQPDKAEPLFLRAIAVGREQLQQFLVQGHSWPEVEAPFVSMRLAQKPCTARSVVVHLSCVPVAARKMSSRLTQRGPGTALSVAAGRYPRIFQSRPSPGEVRCARSRSAAPMCPAR